MKKGFALALAGILAASAFLFALPRAAAEDDLCFMVAENTVTSFGPFSLPHGPYREDGWMMVPLRPLTDSTLEYNLNLHSQWSETNKRLTIYDGRGTQLTFEYGQDTAFSGDEQYEAPLFRSNPGTYFVPVELICEVFDLYYSGEYATEWGTMVRVCSLPLAFSDESYLRSFRSDIQEKYNAYISANSPSSPPPGAASPSPTVPFPSPSPPAPVLNSVSVYITFNGAPNGATAPLLDYLEANKLPAIFFLPPDSLSQNPAPVRRIAARHHVGLFLDVPEGEAFMQTLHEGNALLRDSALLKTWLVRAENAPLDMPGYRFWGATLSFTEEDTAADIVKTAEPLLIKTTKPSSKVVLALPHSEASLEALITLAELLAENDKPFINPGESPAA